MTSYGEKGVPPGYTMTLSDVQKGIPPEFNQKAGENAKGISPSRRIISLEGEAGITLRAIAMVTGTVDSPQVVECTLDRALSLVTEAGLVRHQTPTHIT